METLNWAAVWFSGHIVQPSYRSKHAELFRRTITMSYTHATLCPQCEATLQLPANVMENELIVCPDCGVDLEVLSLDPVEVALAPEVEEDWGE
jgi:alpha-aminoadipate carrier protein LysW